MNSVDTFYGIYDFFYAPFALGDAITWQINVQIGAIEKNANKISHCLVLDPEKPFFSLQYYVTRNNCHEFLDNIYPAFLCNNNLGEIQIIHHHEEIIRLYALNPNLVWPDVVHHVKSQLDYYSHRRINAFYKKNGYIPLIKGPKGYETSMDSFIDKKLRNRVIVSVNIRQRKCYSNAHLEKCVIFYRDSNIYEWILFFKQVEKQYPEVIFLILGGINEWERELFSLSNVCIPRTMGYNLGHELTILQKSALFMGTSSGFAAFATFSAIPYIITNYEHSAAVHVGITIGARQYPFAKKNQILNWDPETCSLLLNLFNEVYPSLNNNDLNKEV